MVSRVQLLDKRPTLFLGTNQKSTQLFGVFDIRKQDVFPGRRRLERSFLDRFPLLLMVQKSGDHQLRLVVYPIIYRVFNIHPNGGCLGFLPSTVGNCSLLLFYLNLFLPCFSPWFSLTHSAWLLMSVGFFLKKKRLIKRILTQGDLSKIVNHPLTPN